MPEYTSKLNLYKPNRVDSEITVDTSLSANFQKIDDGFGEVTQQLAQITVSITDFGASVSKSASENTVAIQNAIDHVASVGGGRVLIPANTQRYAHGTIYLKSNVELVGVGEGSVLHNTTDAPSIVIGSEGVRTSFTKIMHLKITGDRTKSNNHGIVFIGDNPSYHVLENLHISAFGGHGIYGGHVSHVNNVEIKSCFITTCEGDGIHIQYTDRHDGNVGQWQINAVWVHHNNITRCRNGVLFFGNNFIIEDNTIQASKIAGISMSDASAIGQKYSYSAAIRSNYFELNGTDLTDNVSPIVIYVSNISGGTNTKQVHGLVVENNYFGENGTKYRSLVHIEDTELTSSGLICTLATRCNYNTAIPIISFNNPKVLSKGCVIDEQWYYLVEPILSKLPASVDVRGAYTSPVYNLVHRINSYLPKKIYTLTLYLDSLNTSDKLNFDMSELSVNVSGAYVYGNPARFNHKAECYAASRFGSDVVSHIASGSSSYVPTLSKIQVVDFNGKYAYQFTLTARDYGGHAIFYMDLRLPPELRHAIKLDVAVTDSI